jgi:hypothetical protein
VYYFLLQSGRSYCQPPIGNWREHLSYHHSTQVTISGDKVSSNLNVLVFPNPVPPGNTGTTGIRGLVENAIGKITELDGRLVYQTRASGGQAVWNGKDYKGRQISTGIYRVFVSNDSKT